MATGPPSPTIQFAWSRQRREAITLSRPHRYEWFTQDGAVMREQLAPESIIAGTFVTDQIHCCYADADDTVDPFQPWCAYCASLHQRSGGTAIPSDDGRAQGHEAYANNVDDGCPMFPVHAEVVRETIVAILADMGIEDHRQCCPDADAAITFEARLRTMVQASIRRNPGTRAFSYDHVLRRFVADEWG
jgi:hypothetical protein